MHHLRFDWRRAILGRVDILHLHWPEVLLESRHPIKRAGKRALMRLLLLRLSVTPTRVVRTVHNVALPDVSPPTRRLLLALDERTAYRIILNPLTEVDEHAALIPHGHYREWFAPFPHRATVEGQVGYFGLIRRYKGVESLLAAFKEARAADPSLTLRLGGRPTSTELEVSIAAQVASLDGVTSTLRFLDDHEIVEIATSSQLLVFPYRFMHNSGGALAALSLDRPVLLPRNSVNELLAAEAGPKWVQLYDGDLTGTTLRDALARVSGLRGSPSLDGRGWADAGARHGDVYNIVVQGLR